MQKEIVFHIGTDVGGVVLQAVGPLNALLSDLIYSELYELRHPLGIYNVSISRIEKRLNRLLQFLEQAFREVGLPEQTKRENELVISIIDYMELFIYALAEHIDDCELILQTLFPTKVEFSQNKTVREFKSDAKSLRDEFSHLANAIKHNHQRLRLFLMPYSFTDGAILLIGFFIERAIKGVIRPDPEFHIEGKQVVSVTAFIWSCLIRLVNISRILSDAVIQIKNVRLPLDLEMKMSFGATLSQLAILPFYTFDDINPLKAAKVKLEMARNNQTAQQPLVGSLYHPANPSSSIGPGRWTVSYEGDGVTRSFKLPDSGDLTFLATVKSVGQA